MIPRYKLRDRELLKQLMQHPGRGTPFTVRSLAAEIGLSHHSLVGHLVSGQRDECDANIAHDLSEALGVAVLVLFAPPASPRQTDPATDSRPPS